MSIPGSLAGAVFCAAHFVGFACVERRMTLFRHPEDRIPVLLFACVFALDLTVYFMAQQLVAAHPVVRRCGIIPKGWISAWNHHHQHLTMFRHALPNRLLEVVFGFQTGVTSHAWFLHHVVGHHRNYLDQDKDESRWKRADGIDHGRAGVLAADGAHGLSAGLPGGAEEHPKALRVFLAMGALQVALLGVLFWHNWYNALFVFLLPMARVALRDGVGHVLPPRGAGDGRSTREASYNILHRGYNLMTGNLGYHTAHHTSTGCTGRSCRSCTRSWRATSPPTSTASRASPSCGAARRRSWS